MAPFFGKNDLPYALFRKAPFAAGCGERTVPYTTLAEGEYFEVALFHGEFFGFGHWRSFLSNKHIMRKSSKAIKHRMEMMKVVVIPPDIH